MTVLQVCVLCSLEGLGGGFSLQLQLGLQLETNFVFLYDLTVHHFYSSLSCFKKKFVLFTWCLKDTGNTFLWLVVMFKWQIYIIIKFLIKLCAPFLLVYAACRGFQSCQRGIPSTRRLSSGHFEYPLKLICNQTTSCPFQLCLVQGDKQKTDVWRDNFSGQI